MIKMKKSNMAIAFSVVALILGSVLAGCQMEIPDSLDLGGTPTTGVNTGVTGGTGSYSIPHIALYWDGNEAAERTGDTITWPAYDLGASTPATVTRTAKAVFKHPPEGFEYLQWTFETDTNARADAAADGLLAFGDAWHTGAQDRDSSEMPISAGLGVTKAKITVWNCDSTGKRGKVSSSFTLDVVEFGTAIPPTLKISWDGDNQSHNGEPLTWWKDSGPLDLTAAITDPPANPQVRWTISGSADAVVFDGYTAGSPQQPETPVKIKPGVTFGTGTVTVTAALEGYPGVTESFTIIPGPTLKISWDGDNANHNGDTLTWLKSTAPLNLTAALADAPANPQVRWTISGSADAVVFDGYTAGTLMSPADAVKIKPGVTFGTGTVTITAALEGYPGVTESFTIIPGAIPVSSVTVSPKTLNLQVGDTADLTADVLPADADNPTVVWTSETPGVATVNSGTGRVTGVAQGTAVIRATADGQSDTCMVTVTLPNSVVLNFSITGGYVGPASINYYNPDETLSVTVTAAGTLEYASGTVPTGDVWSIGLKKPGLAGGNEDILIGREAPSDSNKIELSINGDGVLAFRSPVNGNIPIGSYAEFQLINASATSNSTYKLEADLDLLDEDWTPVGGSGNEFLGTFDGAGHTLSNLKIFQATTEPVGLFGTVGRTVKNLQIESGEVNGGRYVGGVVGELKIGGKIEYCSSKAVVYSQSGSTADNLVGKNDGTVIRIGE
ncbi:hypothetical protein AGMMS49991_10880 [Spirochaetia bacterium]|nr:hypothetical protein AGMMS49991_10880 [Spirochaetia bacterium]